MTDFTARRAVLKSIVKILIAATVGILLGVAFRALYAPDPQDFADKLLQCLYFCVFIVGEVFAFMFCVDGVRDILAPPTVSVKDGVLKIFGYPAVSVSDVDRVEMTDLSKKEGKHIPAVAVFVKGEESPLIIKRNYTGISLDTVKYAIEVRLNKE